MVDHKYRWDFIGLSTDSKPTASSPRVVNGSTYYEADTSKAYVWYNDRWYEKEASGSYELPIASAETLGGVKVGNGLAIDEGGVLSTSGGGGGGFTTLTSEDYNYPENNPDSVALWLLDAGTYYVDNSSSLATKVKVYNTDMGMYYNCSFFEVIPLPQSSYILINVYGNFSSGDTEGYYGFRQYKVDQSGNEAGHVVYASTDDLKSIAPQMLNTGNYDFPANNPTGIAVWNLAEGEYKINASDTDPVVLHFDDQSTFAMPMIWANLVVKDIKNGDEKMIWIKYMQYENSTYDSQICWGRISMSTKTFVDLWQVDQTQS